MAKSDYLYFNKAYLYDINNKKANTKHYIDNILNKTSTMFEWRGLPDTIEPCLLEKMLQSNGHVGFAKIDEYGYYIFCGEFGGAPNIYYLPSTYIVANPALEGSKQFWISWPFGDAFAMAGRAEQIRSTTSGECYILKNDTNFEGLLPIISRYASLLVENDISINLADILCRTQYAITAGDENTRASAVKFIEDLQAGRLSVIGDNAFIDSLKTIPLSAANGATLKELIELEQYLKGSLLNEIGLNANFNMKRERIQNSESELNSDGLTPLIIDMLGCRRAFCDQINNELGLNVSVGVCGAWEKELAELNESITDAEVAPEAGDAPEDSPEGAIEGVESNDIKE